MPAGRSQVDYTDIRYDGITLKIDGVTITYDPTKANGIGKAVGTGDAVTYSADDTCALTLDGSFVIGKLLKVEKDGFATIQDKGFMTFGKGDSAPGTATRGRSMVGATLAAVRGFIRDVNTAVAAELGLQSGKIHNVADALAIVVEK